MLILNFGHFCLILILAKIIINFIYRRYVVHDVHQRPTLHHQPQSIADAGVDGTGRV